MPLNLSEVESKEDFAPLVPVEFEAYSTPLNEFWEILKGPSVSECLDRQWADHEADPKSHWLKITDTDTGAVVGGAEWVVHETNPYEKPVPIPSATWWPEGVSLSSI